MSASVKLTRIHQHARRRAALIAALRWLPWLAFAGVIAWFVAGSPAAITVLTLGALLLAAHFLSCYRARDRQWLIRQLNSHDRTLDDSSDLLFDDTATLSPLQQLQRARVSQRLVESTIDLREPLPGRELLSNALAAALCGVALWLWHLEFAIEPSPNAASASAAPMIHASPSQSLLATLEVNPPMYTGLAAQTGDALSVEVAQDSRLRWSLAFAIPPTAVRLQFVGGASLTLSLVDGQWQGDRVMEASTLYRIEIEGAASLPDTSPYRIDVRADAGPKLTIIEPQRTLTVLDAAATRWKLSFDAADDYGLGAVNLLLTLAQGSGEQVSVSERRIALRGVGNARQQHFDYSVNLSSLGFAQGDDLIVRLEARDLRQPLANVSRSASFILRWPAEQSSDGTGVEGLVQKTLPAYFRSQRQVIIDTEALIEERAGLSSDTALARSDAIGVDQRILRLRYGQFLGEETEDTAHAGGEGQRSDDPADQDHADEDSEKEAHADHEHVQAALGNSAELIAEFGHTHDIAEAATLLDAGTRKLLRAALGEMWQAELHLRTGEPSAALPFENRALDYIKRVQQASRIYLARVGLELPEIDPARRLTGERPRAGRRSDPLHTSDDVTIPVQTWRALRDDAALPLDAMQRWLSVHSAEVTEPLALLQDIDELQRTPECSACRTRLATRLWPLLTPPAVMPMLRPRADDVDRAYLDALTPAAEAL